MRTRHVISAMAMLAALGVASGAAPAAAQQPAGLAHVSVAMSGGVAGATIAVYLAQDKGYFKDEGLDVQITNMNNPNDNTVTVVSGKIDIAVTNFSAGFWNIAGHGNLRIIAGDLREAPGFKNMTITVSNKAYDAGFTKAADIAGKTVTLGTLGSASQYQVLLLSRKYHFPFNSVKLTPLQNNGNEAAAIKVGSVDAAILPGLPAVALEKTHDAHIVAWIGDEVPMLAGGVLVRADMIAKQPDILVKFMRAYLHASHDYAAGLEKLDAKGNIIKGPGADEMINILAKDTNQTPDLIYQSTAYIEPDGAVNQDEVAQQITDWQSLGLVDKDVDPHGMVDLSILKAAQQAK